MPTVSFVDLHLLWRAFLGEQLARLSDVIADQSDALLSEAGLSFRAQTMSTVLLLSEREGLSIADIARDLNLTHQLVAQRIDALTDVGLVQKRPDANDRRRKILALTPAGAEEAAILLRALRKMCEGFEDLNRELGVDVSAIALTGLGALSSQPLARRTGAARGRRAHPPQ